ncbi:MAG TPA: M20/M25/M40 family metallo-hydrolase [Bryobacteraceae bacterium]|nr:M20/M25/M40 family metallo-hydrolase [Bryobacteraceae bacterium]
MKRMLVFFGAAVTVLAATDYVADGALWFAHIQALAGDEMQGREMSSKEFRKATEYVAAKFETFGLKPGGTSAYFQPVKFESRTLVAGKSAAALVRDGKRQPLDLDKEVTLGTRGALDHRISAAMVFVGYGLSIPELKYDDLAGIDLRGKIAVVVNAGGPVEADTNIKSHYSSAIERWKALHKAGAIGMATIQNPRTAGTTGTAQAGTGRGPRTPTPTFMLADAALRENEGQKISLAIPRAGGAKFFEGSEHTFDEIYKLATDNKPLPHFTLAAKLEVKVVAQHASVEAANVVGILPGSDPVLQDQYVVFSAHLDHLGVGRPVNGDSIYNGVMDNASGVASVLEVARLFHDLDVKPKRSIIFVTVTGEEKGELGSRYFASHPTVPRDRIVADVNLDMYLPLYALKVLEVQGLAESTLGDAVRIAAKQEGVEVQTDREPEQNRFIRSDQYSFIREGIPALAFKFGYEYGSAEEKTRQTWVKERYHRPSDDLSQPLDQAAAARFNRVIFNLLGRVADDPEKPHWNANSFFRRFAK